MQKNTLRLAVSQILQTIECCVERLYLSYMDIERESLDLTWRIRNDKISLTQKQ